MAGNLLIAALFVFLGVGICIRSYYLGIGKLSQPSAGFLPFGIGFFLMLCSLALFINHLLAIRKQTDTDEHKVWSHVNFIKVLFVLLCLVIYMIFLGRFGFLPTAFLVQLLLFKVVGSQKWALSLMQTAITIAFVYLVFIVLLDVYIPLFPKWVF
jgi:hypothetical protein